MNAHSLSAKAIAIARAHRTEIAVAGAGVIAPLALFGALAEDIAAREPLRFDASVLTWLHAHATPTLDRIMLAVTAVGSARIMAGLVALALVWLLLARSSRDAIFLGLAAGGAEAFNLGLKATFERPRPHLWPSLTPEFDWSFPSGHAMGTVAVVAALVVLTWGTRWRWPVLVLGTMVVALIGLSRLYLGVHYPSDVIAGAAASLAWVTALTMSLRRSVFTTPVTA